MPNFQRTTQKSRLTKSDSNHANCLEPKPTSYQIGLDFGYVDSHPAEAEWGTEEVGEEGAHKAAAETPLFLPEIASGPTEPLSRIKPTTR